jgi:hypothetical protein
MENMSTVIQSTTPVVGVNNFTAFPSNPYAWFDFFTGLVVGMFTFLNVR